MLLYSSKKKGRFKGFLDELTIYKSSNFARNFVTFLQNNVLNLSLKLNKEITSKIKFFSFHSLQLYRKPLFLYLTFVKNRSIPPSCKINNIYALTAI